MKRYLLPETGNFYKANLHCHTTYSDGKKTPEEVKALYRSMGYSVVAFTDHDILIPHDELTDGEFLALHGFEWEINEAGKTPWELRKCCHICCIGIDPETLNQPLWHRSEYLFKNAVHHRDEVKFDENEPDYTRVFSGEDLSYMMKTASEKGFFVTYNHPEWSREDYSNYMGYSGMNAFEMFNGTSYVAGFEDYNPRVYDDMLRGGKRIYCIGADDNHNDFPDDSRRSDSGVAFTMIKAASLDYKTVTNALVNGHFYASEAPEIYALWFENGQIHIQCSAADRIAVTYGARRARVAYAEGEPITEASFATTPGYGYFRITVTDANGKRACTNAYFEDALTE